jgi:hypothetical protein
MARVALLSPDLLFGSKVEGMLRAAGHADALVVDLTDDAGARIERVAGLAGRPPALAFYSHVEHDVRVRAEQAGLELVVPRSRMAREGAALVERLLAGSERTRADG